MRRNKKKYLLLLSCFSLLCTPFGCATVLPSTNEYLDWDVGNFVLMDGEKTGWKGFRGETYRFIYVKRGETSKNWTVKLEVTDLPIAITRGSRIHWNPESVMNAEKANMQKKQCTDVWTVIQKDEKSILYERQNISCPGYLHQYELGRIVMGRWYLWWISYGIRDKVLSEDERLFCTETCPQACIYTLYL